MSKTDTQNQNVIDRGYIAVALQYKNRKQLIRDIQTAQDKKAEIIEIRFDYNDQLVSLLAEEDNNKFEDLKEEVFRTSEIFEIKKILKIPVIFTLRKKSQGGNLYIPEKVRLDLINYLATFQPDYIDIETDSDLSFIQELDKKVSKYGGKLILSYHNWEKTPAAGHITKSITEFIEKLPSINHSNRNILKLIFTANHIQDNYRVLDICKKFKADNINLICFCMGGQGVPSRVSSIIFGGFLSFASIDEATAPGQVNIELFKKMLDKAIRLQQEK